MEQPPSRPRVPITAEPGGPGVARRAFLARTAALGAATWAAPTVLSTTPVAAATGSCSGVTVHEFGSGLDGWTIDNAWGPGVEGLWRHNRHPQRDGGALHYGRGFNGSYRTGGQRNSGRVVSPPFTMPNAVNVVRFTVFRSVEVENSGLDRFRLVINAAASEVLYSVSSVGDSVGFESYTITVPAAYNGQSVTFQFDFDTMDGSNNRYEGVYVGRFEVTACPLPAAIASSVNGRPSDQAAPGGGPPAGRG